MSACRLSVNINKVALLRNSRPGNIPNLIQVACDCEKFGAEGITVHPRPDERHIRYTDVRKLKKAISTRFNIEGYPNKKFIELVLAIKPEQVTLVPDAPDARTSDQGWDIKKNFSFLSDIIQMLQAHNIWVSLFVEPCLSVLEEAARMHTNAIELYTGPYAQLFLKSPQKAIEPYIHAAKFAKELSLAVHAGHDLNLKNLNYLKKHLPQLEEVSIGHALIADALYDGLKTIIPLYKKQL